MNIFFIFGLGLIFKKKVILENVLLKISTFYQTAESSSSVVVCSARQPRPTSLPTFSSPSSTSQPQPQPTNKSSKEYKLFKLDIKNYSFKPKSSVLHFHV